MVTGISTACARMVAATVRTSNAVFYHIYVPTVSSINFRSKVPTDFVLEAAVNGILKILNGFRGYMQGQLLLQLEPLTLYFIITRCILFVNKFSFKKVPPFLL